jgi:hypothetical protein
VFAIRNIPCGIPNVLPGNDLESPAFAVLISGFVENVLAETQTRTHQKEY